MITKFNELLGLILLLFSSALVSFNIVQYLLINQNLIDTVSIILGILGIIGGLVLFTYDFEMKRWILS